MLRCLTARGVVYFLFTGVLFLVGAGLDSRNALAQSRLTLRPIENVRVIPKMRLNRQGFTVYLLWDIPPDNISAAIHPPDTTGWNAKSSNTPQSALTVPNSSGVHTGDIDRTVSFRALEGGMVGQRAGPNRPQIRLRYDIIGEEEWRNTINVGEGYTPGSVIRCIFIHEDTGQTLDLGLRLSFGNGVVDSNGVFLVGLEDYEGFHLWRGTDRRGRDLVNFGELSKEEAFKGEPTDSVYFNMFIPALRDSGKFFFQEPVFGIPASFNLSEVLPEIFSPPNDRLGPNQLIWVDVNAFNGFTYYYAITAFDRGYNVRSRAQGLVKRDACFVDPDSTNCGSVKRYEDQVVFDCIRCASSLVAVSTANKPQDDLQQVYVVPNPYRSGGSQYTTPNYHNFPDGKIRFVNVPADCVLRIYTPAGDLVWDWPHRSNSGNIAWDTRNLEGNEVASGIYIYRLQSADGRSVYGRIVIIR